MKGKHQKTILIIEAHQALQKLYEAELQEAGFNTLLAASNVEAQQLLHDHAVDLLISDLRERQAAGMSTLVSLAKDRSIPLLINTGYPLSMIDRAAIREAAWVQEKSSDIDNLKDKIGELLGNGERRLQLYQGNAVKRGIEGKVEQRI
jgi:DNA-binding NtrC family response regulator